VKQPMHCDLPPVHRSYLIVESGHTGHLLVFVRILARAAVSNGAKVILALTPEAVSSAEYRLNLLDLSETVEVMTWDGSLSPRTLADLARKSGATDVVIPHADPVVGGLAFGWPLLRSTRLHLLIMRDPRWETPAPIGRRVKNLLKLAVIRLVDTNFQARVVWLREPGHRSSGPELAAVDPFVPDGSEAEIEEAIAVTRAKLLERSTVFWFGITGAVSLHKNVPLVVEAVIRLKALRPDLPIGFALLGPIGTNLGITIDEINLACAQAEVPIVIDDRVLSNLEMNAAVGALDAVVMAYSTHSPNSTLGKAWVLGTRVVAAGPDSIRRFVRSIDAGYESALTVEGIAGSMGAAYDSPSPASHADALSVTDFAGAVLGFPKQSSSRNPHA